MISSLLTVPGYEMDWLNIAGRFVLMLWGGIRGAVAVALALSLSIELPHWYTIQSMVYGVALFSLVFQAPLFSFLSQPKSSPG